MSSVRPLSAVNSINAVPPLNLNTVAPATTSHGRRSSTRPATASHTARSSVSGITTDVEIDESTLHRNAVAFFDTFKNHDMKEVIAQTTACWLLSTDFRGNAGPVHGMLSDLNLSQDPYITVLMPKEEGTLELEYREVHQIVRDLTVGIYALNQLPSLILEPNFDHSTTCCLPLAYKNTLVGKTLISLDYAMKSLWHGAVVPDKKRASLAERWRSLVDMNSATGEINRSKFAFKEFSSAGQQYITDDERFAGIYDELNAVDPSEFIKKRENSFFNSYADYVRCVMTFRIDSVKACRHVNLVNFSPCYNIESQILAAEDKIEAAALQKLRRRLRNQMDAIRKNIEKNSQTKRNLELVKLISFLSPLLTTMRRRMMRIPDVDSMLSVVSSETIYTDTELPPFAFSEDKDRPCLTFEGPGITHTHGGICFDIETENIEEFSEVVNAESIVASSAENLRQIFEENSKKPQYSVPTTIIGKIPRNNKVELRISIEVILKDGREYYVIHIPITTYYPATPPQPGWLHALYKELSNLRPRRLPMNDMQIHELFKKTFGFKKAFASKNVEAGLKICTCRGLIAPFIALMRKVNSNALFSPDLQGLTLVHYAAIHNQPAILSILLSQQNNVVNLRRTTIRVKSEKKQETADKRSLAEELDERTGLSPLHYAARCGSTECCTMLLACKANPILSDDHGWSVMHHAAHCGHESILRILLRRQPNLLDCPATGSDCSTPLLVAASGGSVDCVRYLIKMGAKHDAVDAFGDNAVHRSALNFHTPVLEYFIKRMEKNETKSLPVWDLLVGMLESGSVRRQDATLRCLEMLLHRTPSYWKPLLSAGAVAPLVALLGSNKKIKPSSNIDVIEDEAVPIRSLACAVVCLMSEQDDVRRAVSDAGAILTLIELLTPIGGHSGTVTCELQSRSSVVLSDLACVDNNASRIAKHGGILPLVNLLHVDVVDVLVNAVNTLGALCQSDKEGDNQRQVVECGAVTPLVELLAVREEVLPSATAAAIAEVCRFNGEIQDVFLDAGVLQPLVAILRGRNFKAKVQAARAIESLTQDNQEAQKLAAIEGAAEALCTMFQAINISVREQGARALWALAGDQPGQQRQIAMQIGLRQIKDMLNSKSETLQLVGCQAVAASAYMRTRGQNELADYDDMISNLIRLLRLDHTTRPVIAAVIHAINSLCIGVAGLNNKNVQLKIAEAGAIELLAQRVWECSHDECLQVELLHCVASAVVGCPPNENQLNDLDTFGFEIVMELLNSFNQKVRQRAVSTLAKFSFNRIPQQKRISRLGGLSMLIFEDLLCSLDLTVRAEAAFQMVVLARIISDSTIVDISAKGILILVEFLDRFDENLLIVTAQCIAGLSHTRAGVADAMVTSGVVSRLLRLLLHDNGLLRMAASQALGYLSFNRVASRELISACRSTAGLYEAFTDNNGEDGKISSEFIAEYRRQCAVGLPIAKAITTVIREPDCVIAAVLKSQEHPGNDVTNGFVTKKGKHGKRLRPSLRSRSLSPAVLVTETPRK